MQLNGLSWNRLTTQTSLQIAATDTLGQLTTQAQVSLLQGGTGLSLSLTVGQANQVLQVNTTGTSLTIGAFVPQGPIIMYQYSRFL